VVPKITVDPDFNPFKEEKKSNVSFPTKRAVSSENWEALYTHVEVESSETNQASLFASKTAKETGKTLQIQRKYILSSIKTGVVLISQSLAHQRILYENFLESITVKEANSQQLLFPVNIQLVASEIEILYSLKTELENAGFSFDEFTKTGVTIKGIPVSVTESQITVILEELIRDIDLEVPDASFSSFDLMAKSFSKTLAIKTGAVLSALEQENLVNDLFSCKEPSISPFGKSTFKTLTLKEIDLIFNN
jgi:DNA mismatch repair protein MutL